MSERVAVLGLGIIGSVWARHLHADGVLTASWNRTPQPDAPLCVDTPAMAARRADQLIVVVADPAAVQNVLDDLLPELESRHTVIQSSTIGPADAQRFRSHVTGRGAHYLEAPFTGSKPAAEKREIVFYCGGDAATLASVDGVLARLSPHRLHIGTHEQACQIKLAMNLQIATLTEALCEALTIARKAGINDDTFFTCMQKNASWSGLAALKEPKLRAADYDPQFSIKHLLKDVRLLQQAVGSMPAVDMAVTQLERAMQAGWADADFGSLIEVLS